MSLRAVGSAIAQVASHLTATAGSTIIAALLSVPLVVLLGAAGYLTHQYPLVPLGLLVLLGVLPNPAAAGVQYLAHQLAHHEYIYLADQAEGLRRYWRIALRLWLISTAITVILAGNLAFYATEAHFGAARIITALWLIALVIWLAAHLYVFPLIIEQEVKRPLLIYRNALVLTLARPGFTLVVGMCWFPLLLVSSATGLILIVGLALTAGIQQNAAARLLPAFGATAPE